MAGNPRCSRCRGRGIIRTTTGYAKCVCVNGTQTQREMQRLINGAGSRYPEGDAVIQALRERKA